MFESFRSNWVSTSLHFLEHFSRWLMCFKTNIHISFLIKITKCFSLKFLLNLLAIKLIKTYHQVLPTTSTQYKLLRILQSCFRERRVKRLLRPQPALIRGYPHHYFNPGQQLQATGGSLWSYPGGKKFFPSVRAQAGDRALTTTTSSSQEIWDLKQI